MRSLLVKRVLPVAAVVSIALWVLVPGSGADADATTGAASTPEPITGEASWPAPGSETGPLRPFDPPPELPGALQFDDLTPAEQAVVVASDWPNAAQVAAAYSAATTQAAQMAAAAAAANSVGLEGIGGSGMVAP